MRPLHTVIAIIHRTVTTVLCYKLIFNLKKNIRNTARRTLKLFRITVQKNLEKKKSPQKLHVSPETTWSHDIKMVKHQIVEVAVFQKIEF